MKCETAPWLWFTPEWIKSINDRHRRNLKENHEELARRVEEHNALYAYIKEKGK